MAGGRTYLTFADRAPGRFFLLVLFDLGFCVFFFFFDPRSYPPSFAHPRQRGRCRPEFGAKALRDEVSLGCAWSLSPGSRIRRSQECAPSGARGGLQPRSRPPSGTPPAACREPPSARLAARLPVRASLCTVPFCLLDPWPPKLAANRSEAPLAFRMKSVDFLNSSGHSCIRSGPYAFPMQRVKICI